MTDTLRSFPVNVARGNRAQGLIRELIELVDAEDSALALDRLAVALRSVSHLAAGRSHEIEQVSREVEHRRNARPKQTGRAKWKLV